MSRINRLKDITTVVHTDDGTYINRFNKAHDWRFKDESHVQADLSDLEESWEIMKNSFNNREEAQYFRFLYDAFKLFYFSFNQMDINKKRSINYRGDAIKQEFFNILTGCSLYGMYHHGKKCIDLLFKLKLIEDEDIKKFCKKFSETRNKFIEHNYNPNKFSLLKLEPLIWSTVSTNSLMEICVHGECGEKYVLCIDYYQDYFDLEMVMRKSFSPKNSHGSI